MKRKRFSKEEILKAWRNMDPTTNFPGPDGTRGKEVNTMADTVIYTLECRLQVAVAAFVEMLRDARTQAHDPEHINIVDRDALLYLAERTAEAQKTIVNLLRRSK